MKVRHLATGFVVCILAANPAVPAHASVPNATAGEPAIAWGPCPEAWVGPDASSLGARLQCGSMAAPLDHEAPDGHLLEIGVIRVRASIPALREGSIFLNRGGPGSHPGKLLQAMARAWSASSDLLYKRRLAERFDLVAVIPRGLVGSGELRCLTGMPSTYSFLPGDLGDDNWNRMLAEAQAVADACSAPLHARYINTEQHAHDMDMLRRALGDQRIHFYGISHGSLVGAWYASLYPEHTGRMLWDSAFDVTRDYSAAIRSSITAQHDAIARKALAPVLRNPVRYGLGSDPDLVAEAVNNLPSRVREIRPGSIASPEELAATLHVALLWTLHQPATLDVMSRLLQEPLSPEAGLDARIRHLANQLAGLMYAPRRTTPLFQMGGDGDSVRVVVPCNDMPWTRTEQVVRQAAREDARRYLSMTGHEVFDEIVCLRWGPPTARPLVHANIDRAAPFLLLQSEHDTATPLAGGTRILDRFANARMLLVRGSAEHGLFNFTRSPCIENTAARYLATGQLPETGSRVFACDGTYGNPLEGIPGEPSPPVVEPVAVPVPGSPGRHEL